MSRLLIMIATMVGLASLCSCNHKELCLHHPHESNVYLEFDWTGAPEADPSGMCVFFYPIEEGEPRRYDFKGKTGGKINIDVGRYMVLCYNNDTEGVLFNGKNDFCCPAKAGYISQRTAAEFLYDQHQYSSNRVCNIICQGLV